MKIISTLLLAALSYTVSAQNVNIPDATFKALLVANTAINTNGDGEIQVSEAVATDSLSVISVNVVNLTGLSAFTNLVYLNIESIPATSVDISTMTLLQKLIIYEVFITTLNLANNANLTSLELGDFNTLSALNLSAITNLTKFDIFLGSLSLTNVNFGNTPTTLQYLGIRAVPDTSVDISSFSQISTLNASYSKFKTIDASNNSLLTRISVFNNDSLTTLNIANGNNANVTVMDADVCPNLTCIYVDSAIVGTTPVGWSKDSTATYCYDTTTVVSLNQFNQASDIRFFPNPAADYLNIENAQIGAAIFISDALGRVVLRQELSSENTQIATSNLQNGIYFIQFELNGLRTRAEKILISK